MDNLMKTYLQIMSVYGDLPEETKEYVEAELEKAEKDNE